jgi:hypothetical protein
MRRKVTYIYSGCDIPRLSHRGIHHMHEIMQLLSDLITTLHIAWLIPEGGGRRSTGMPVEALNTYNRRSGGSQDRLQYPLSQPH